MIQEIRLYCSGPVREEFKYCMDARGREVYILFQNLAIIGHFWSLTMHVSTPDVKIPFPGCPWALHSITALLALEKYIKITPKPYVGNVVSSIEKSYENHHFS